MQATICICVLSVKHQMAWTAFWWYWTCAQRQWQSRFQLFIALTRGLILCHCRVTSCWTWLCDRKVFGQVIYLLRMTTRFCQAWAVERTSSEAHWKQTLYMLWLWKVIRKAGSCEKARAQCSLWREETISMLSVWHKVWEFLWLDECSYWRKAVCSHWREEATSMSWVWQKLW